MAKLLNSHVFARSSGQYPWSEWLDGNIRELEAGTDFTKDAKNMRSAFAGAARRALKGSRTQLLDNGNVIVQAYDLAEDAKTALAAKIRAQDAKNAAKRAAAAAKKK